MKNSGERWGPADSKERTRPALMLAGAPVVTSLEPLLETKFAAGQKSKPR